MAKKKDDPIVLRTIHAGNKEVVLRAQLIALQDQVRVIVIEEQKATEKEVESLETIRTSVKEIKIVPNYEGISKEESAKRLKSIDAYLKKNSVTDALEEVGKEVVKSKDEKTEDKVISWQPQIEKDLKFPVETVYLNVPGTKEVKTIKTETQYKYKEIHSCKIFYRVRTRDFMKYVHNYLNSIRD